MYPCRLTPQTPALPLEIRVSLPGIDFQFAVILTPRGPRPPGPRPPGNIVFYLKLRGQV